MKKHKTKERKVAEFEVRLSRQYIYTTRVHFLPKRGRTSFIVFFFVSFLLNVFGKAVSLFQTIWELNKRANRLGSANFTRHAVSPQMVIFRSIRTLEFRNVCPR